MNVAQWNKHGLINKMPFMINDKFVHVLYFFYRIKWQLSNIK